MKERNEKQIIRFDGKNVFMEVMNSAFEIGKVQMNFIEYDEKLEIGNRQTKNIPIYMDIPKALALIHNILSGQMHKLAAEAKETAKKGGYRYCKEIFIDLGGVSAETLAKRGKSRPDGLALSRQFKIIPGDKLPWIFQAEIGAGEESETGLIVPKGKPEEVVRVPLTDEALITFAAVLKEHINAYLTSQYILSQQAISMKKPA